MRRILTFVFLDFSSCLRSRGKEEEVLICLQQEDRRVRRKDGGGEKPAYRL